jgi:acetyl-CoA carboxylase, biotin carboxylase subunit
LFLDLKQHTVESSQKADVKLPGSFVSTPFTPVLLGRDECVVSLPRDSYLARMFQKLLIANRGEIARRINQVAQGMGLKTVAVYSDADADLPFVKEAGEAQRIGPAPAKDSYLNVEAILLAAKASGAEAVHPGYGFLSENSDFARAVSAAGLVWVGPPPEAMLRMKDKSQARKLVAAAGVPIIPGSADVVANIAQALEEAERIGFPILCKAAGGGGGIGMTVAQTSADLEKSLRSTMDRARAAFGREGVYLERYFSDTRHLEVQILGDLHGHLIHGLERECSIQRRHQKVVEEAGSPLFLDGKNAELKQKLLSAGVSAAQAFGYANAGTVEFLYADGEIYFIEMNARLQVEHPVTELTTGLNLIEWQLKIAAGEKLLVKQEDVKRVGHALEFRIYAEDSLKFFPSPGPLNVFQGPTGEGIRLDAGYAQGNMVTPHYDPMIAKLIVTAASRPAAIARAEKALQEFRIEGIKNNVPLHQRIVASEAFRAGQLNTRFLEQHAKP